MVVGVRVGQGDTAYRRGHRFGNRMLTGFVDRIFGTDLRDMLSGYRVFSRRFVKSFPALSSGFEIETELTVHALELELPIIEIDTPFYTRPAGSASMLITWRDGTHPVHHPATLPVGAPAGVLYYCRHLVGDPVSRLGDPDFHYLLHRRHDAADSRCHPVDGLMNLGFLSIAVGFVLDTVTRGRREMKLLAYLAQPPFGL